MTLNRSWDEKMNDVKLPKPSTTLLKSQNGDKVEVVKMLIIALVSFAVGFALVYLLLMPSQPGDDESTEIASVSSQTNDDQAATPTGEAYAPDAPATAQEGYAPVEANESDKPAVNEGDLPPELPPGKTPDGVVKDGDAFYLKCWSEDGIEHKGSECDKLNVIEKRFSTRLYVVNKCKVQKAGEDTHGKLSVASEIDFTKTKISFWTGASSDLPNASQVGSCLRESLAGLPIHGVKHKFARYRMFYTVLFGKAAQKKNADIAAAKASFISGKGRLVNVVKNHVRVRKTPVDGDIIGKISTGSQARFLKKKDDWCKIITPNGNQGWMICNALEL